MSHSDSMSGKSSMGNGGKSASAAGQDMQAQMSALKSDLAELSDTVAKYGKAQADSIANQAREGLHALSERGSRTMHAAAEMVEQRYSDTEEYVRSHPAAAVGIAAGLGFLVGLVASRR